MFKFIISQFWLVSTGILIALASFSSTAGFTSNNEQPINFKPKKGEPVAAYSGYLMVPENRKNPSSQLIRVNYVRFPATGKSKGNPIVYLSGGPGGSGTGTAKRQRFELFMALREFGDVIAFDQRGTGESQQHQNCVSDYQFPRLDIISDAQIKQDYRAAAKQCIAQWKAQGIDVYGYTTEQSAWDLNDLRKHLGAKKLTLWGISYGTHLALAAAKQFPEYIDRMVLASAEGLNQTVKLPAETGAYFERVNKVLKDTRFADQIDDLPTMMKRVLAKLEKQPLSVEYQSPRGGLQKMQFQRSYLQLITSAMISDPNARLGSLLDIYLALDNGNSEPLIQLLQSGFMDPSPIRFRLMTMAMDVASGISESRHKLVLQQAEQSIIGTALNFPMPLLSKVDEKLDLGDAFRADPTANIPTLLLTGTLDGRTYPDPQLAAMGSNQLVQRVIIKNAGHNLFMVSPEVTSVIKVFLKTGKANKIQITVPVSF